MRKVPGAAALILLGLVGTAAAEGYAPHQSSTSFSLPGVQGGGGFDEVRAADGTACRSSTANSGACVDVGAVGNQNGGALTGGSVCGRVVVPMGRRPGRIDCNRIYELEVERPEMEVRLLRAGFGGARPPAATAPGTASGRAGGRFPADAFSGSPPPAGDAPTPVPPSTIGPVGAAAVATDGSRASMRSAVPERTLASAVPVGSVPVPLTLPTLAPDPIAPRFAALPSGPIPMPRTCGGAEVPVGTASASVPADPLMLSYVDGVEADVDAVGGPYVPEGAEPDLPTEGHVVAGTLAAADVGEAKVGAASVGEGRSERHPIWSLFSGD